MSGPARAARPVLRSRRRMHHPVDDALDDGLDVARKVRSARPVSPPPHGLSRGKRALSTSSTRAPACARRIAVADPAGPAPTTRTSKRSTRDRRHPGRGATRARAGRNRPCGDPRSGDVEPTRCADASLVRAVTYLALAAGVALLAVSIGLGLRDRGEKQRASDHALTSKAADQATRLEEYFARARSIMLITAQNPRSVLLLRSGRSSARSS